MSNCTDSLKKKVCVTVFLDELFEEVKGDDNVTDSEKFTDKEADKVSYPGVCTEEEVHVVLDVENKPKDEENVQRPRKHRKESKFSKNPCRVLRNLSRHKLNFQQSQNWKGRALTESGISTSDFDDSQNKVNNFSQSRNASVSEISDVDALLDASYYSSKMRQDKSKDYKRSIQYCSKSTQVTNNEIGNDNANDDKVGNGVALLQEEQRQLVEDIAWKKTQKQIQLILAKAKQWYDAKENCEGDCMRLYDLRSIVEESDHIVYGRKKTCSNTEGWSTEFYESDAREMSDSYTCVFPHNKHRVEMQNSDKKHYLFTEKNRKDGFESDLSELESKLHPDESVVNPTLDYNPLVCYTSCIKFESEIFRRKYDFDENNEKIKSVKNLETNTGLTKESSVDSVHSNKSQFQSILLIDRRSLLKQGSSELMEKSDFKTKKSKETVNDERNKNSKSSVLVCLKSKDQLCICEKILNKVKTKSDNEKNLTAAGKRKEDFLSLYVRSKTNLKAPDSNKEISNVFVKGSPDDNYNTTVFEPESETIFAESVISAASQEPDSKKPEKASSAVPVVQSANENVSILQFEDELIPSKGLNRIKTMEILGDSSANLMGKISAEVILICENFSNDHVYLEAWQSKDSIDCSKPKGSYFLKDSKNSSMYLIEVPLRLKTRNKQKLLE